MAAGGEQRRLCQRAQSVHLSQQPPEAPDYNDFVVAVFCGLLSGGRGATKAKRGAAEALPAAHGRRGGTQHTRGRGATNDAMGRERGREPTEHRGREPAEHQGREPAEHQGREPAEHQGPEPDGDDPAMLPQVWSKRSLRRMPRTKPQSSSKVLTEGTQCHDHSQKAHRAQRRWQPTT